MLICIVVKNIKYLIINYKKTELFIRGRKFNISPVFMTKSYFAVTKNIRLNSKFNTLFCYKNSIQKGTSTDCI